MRIKNNSSINIEGYIQTDSLMGKNAGAIIRILGYRINNDTPVFFAYDDTILKGTKSWQNVSFSGKVSGNIDYLVLNGTMQGKGRAWFDDFYIAINKKPIDTVLKNQAPKVSKKELSLLESNSIGLDSIHNDKQFFEKLSQLDTSLKDAQIIGMGEATHGTHEIVKFKHLFFKYLANI